MVVSDPGCLTFAEGRIEVSVDRALAAIVVRRINGKDGKVGCFWNTMEITAKAGTHFQDTKEGSKYIPQSETRPDDRHTFSTTVLCVYRETGYRKNFSRVLLTYFFSTIKTFFPNWNRA